MFEKKVYITESSLIVGKNEIDWSRIVMVRIWDGEVLEFISPSYPLAEIFLEGGKIIVVKKNRNIFFAGSKTSNDVIKLSCQEALKRIKRNAVNINPVLKDWLAWRLVVPSGIIGTNVMFVSLFKGMPIDIAIPMATCASFIIMPFGFFWEKNARKKSWKR